MSRKMEILRECLQFFNEHGFIDPSLRGIANYLGISDGNLRYHFKTKKDILFAMYDQIIAEIQDLIGFQQQSNKIEEFTGGIRKMFSLMRKYRFFFLEYYYLMRKYPELRQKMEKFTKQRRQLMVEKINEMRANRVLSSKYSDEQYNYLVDQIMIISESWINYVDVVGDEDDLEYVIDMSVAILTPYLNLDE